LKTSAGWHELAVLLENYSAKKASASPPVNSKKQQSPAESDK